MNSLKSIVERIIPEMDHKDIVNKLYCMKLAHWVDSTFYGDKQYFFACRDVDPYDYAFKASVGIADRESVRRKLFVIQKLKEFESAPTAVLKEALDRRVAS